MAAARGHNGRGVSGAAPEATLVGYRLISSAPTDEMEASALTTNNHAVHIKSNSWGPDDDGKTVKGPGVLTTLALSNAAATGRGGLGTLIVWAGGNGGGASDNANNDGYVNSPYTLAIAAVTENGTQPWYGEPGACLIAAAPGGGGEVDILTTDLMGNDGDNYAGAGSELSDVNYTQLFKGTSASAPLMALLNGVYAGTPVQAAPPYAVLSESLGSEWGSKSEAGREMLLGLTFYARAQDSIRIAAALRVAEQALEQLPARHDGWQIVTARPIRTRIAGSAQLMKGGGWAALMDVRMRLLAA